MPTLKTFAIIHPLQPEQLNRIRSALTDCEILHSDSEIPPGFERAQAAAIHWTVKDVGAVLEAGTGLQWLHIRSTGVDHLAKLARAKEGLTITNGSGNHAPNIAEHVLAMMLSFARQLPHFVRAQDRNSWSPVSADRVFEISDQHLVIVGLGAIGMELAKRAKGLGMRVTGVRRNAAAQPPQFVDRVVSIAQVDEALATADHVVLALPLTGQSTRLFDRDRLLAIKRGAYIYNVGRGATLDQQALIELLISRHLAGAGLDVTDPEPLPPGSLLWNLPNVLITAHTAGATPRSYERFEALVIDNMKRFNEGSPLLNVVDLSAGY